MTEKEIEEYTGRKTKEIIEETECDDCILFIGKDGTWKAGIAIGNEEVLASNIRTMIRVYGGLGENPYTRQTCLLRALTQDLINEIEEGGCKTGRSCEIYDIIPRKAEDDPPAEEESGMVKRISKRGKPEAEDDPSVEK